MARRRLAPARSVDPDAADVPRAEHLAAPIARIAADAAGAAALEEVTEALTRARETGRLVLDVPLAAIAPDHIARDRAPGEDAEMTALRESLRAHGQRTPIEVAPLAGDPPYGLISGWRRLTALKALFAETGEARFATVQALVRRPDSLADAYVNMVEENEIRLGLSYYERARIAALAVERGVFETEKKALLALFADASRAKRSRIRSFLEVYRALDGTLRFPTHLPERLGLKLVEMVRDGQGARIAAALNRVDPQSPEAERDALIALTRPPSRPASATPAAALRPDVEMRETLRGRTLTIQLTGAGVTEALRAEVRAALASLAPRDRP